MGHHSLGMRLEATKQLSEDQWTSFWSNQVIKVHVFNLFKRASVHFIIRMFLVTLFPRGGG